MDFLTKNKLIQSHSKVLEIGSNYGYNLKFLKDTFECSVYGAEPSKLAVEYGNTLYNNEINLFYASADDLPFEDNFFDVVMIGFCYYGISRNYLLRSISEADRILKNDGYLVVWDFDTKIPS